MERLNSLASESAVVIFSKSSCCMCHTIKILFSQELGVRTVVHELDEEGSNGKEMERALASQLGLKPPVPAVYIGGEFVGSTNRVMSLHQEGTLVELLKSAGEEQTKKIKDMYKDIATNQAQSQEEEDTAEEG